MLSLSLFANDGTGCAGMQEAFLTSLAQIKKKLRLDMDSASVRLPVGVTGAGAGVDNVREQKKPEARKMRENRAESPASSARFVGQAGMESYFFFILNFVFSKK
jgi:hypothetical protein